MSQAQGDLLVPKMMSNPPDQFLLESLLDSRERNNTILLNLLRILPPAGFDAKAMESSPSVAQMFAHVHCGRLVLVREDAPECARPCPTREERAAERDRGRLAGWLNESAQVVRAAMCTRLESDRAMDRHYDHPILLLQHLIWHEGYHHGQIKLAGLRLGDEVTGPVTWSIWMDKHEPASGHASPVAAAEGR